jgi:hypothetical protein
VQSQTQSFHTADSQAKYRDVLVYIARNFYYPMATSEEFTRLNTVDLQLDSQNYRFSPEFKGKLQPETLSILLDHFDAAKLADEIANDGFFKHESLIGIKDKRKTIIIEGNRRLAACKALLEPEKVPDAFKKKMKALSSIANLEDIKTLSVVIYPNRQSAAKLIEKLHVGQGKKPWDTLSKARFDLEFNSESKEDVVRAHRILDSYTVAKIATTEPEIKKVVYDQKKFNVTNLMRVLDAREFRAYLGIEYGADGRLRILIDAEQFRKAIEIIVSDVVTKPSFSRLTDKPIDKEKYLNGLKSTFTPDPKLAKKAVTADGFEKELRRLEKERESAAKGESKAKGPASPQAEPASNNGSETGSDPSASGNDGGENTGGRPQRKPKQANIIPLSFECKVNHQRIQAVFNELKTLPLSTNCNTTAITLRLLLEISLYNFLDLKGEIAEMKKAMIAALKPGQHPRAHWTPDLSDMLKHIAAPNTSYLSGHTAKLIRKMADSNSEDPVFFYLNQYVHNPEIIPTQEGLKQTWQKLAKLFECVLG